MRLLQGVRVIDLGGFITGPFAASLLADFGAEVVKVERPGQGDPFRGLRSDLYSPQFQAHNQNKRSITLDLTKPEGLGVLHKLIGKSDVLVVNNRPGVGEKLGLGYSDAKQINEALIYCSITGFGPSGPYASRPAFDHVGQALSGWLSRFRTNDDPRVVGPVVADRVTGYYAALGVLAALFDRAQTGRGRLVEVNMLESNIAFNIEPISQYFNSRQPIPVYLRGAHSQAYTVTCKDGKRIALHMSTPDKFWRNLCGAIEREEWIEKYKTHATRVEHYEHIAFELANLFRSKDRASWVARLEQFDVPFAPELEVQDLEDDPQIRHLDAFHEVTHPVRGPVKTARRPVWVDADRTIDFRPPPTLGEHADEILGELGYSAEDISVLREKEII